MIAINITVNETLYKADSRAEWLRTEIPSHLPAAATHPANRVQPPSVTCFAGSGPVPDGMPFMIQLRPSTTESLQMGTVMDCLAVALETTEWVCQLEDATVEALDAQ